MGGGMAAETARAIVGKVDKAITATGTNQQTAYPVGSSLAVVVTTPSGTGVQLPRLDDGDSCVVVNLGLNTLLVYPPYLSGRTIDNGVADASVSVLSSSSQTFYGRGNRNYVTSVNGLSASTGSALVGHIAAGVGAVARTLQTVDRERALSVNDFTTPQQAYDEAYAEGRGVYWPAGTYTVAKILYKGQPMFGDGVGKTIIIGSAKSDVFYAPDPSTSETGFLASFPEHMVVQGMTIRVNNSQALVFPTDFNRPVFPLVGTWAATTAYSAVTWMKTASGAIYVAIQGGTSGSVEPSHTFGRAYDGTVIWEYVWSAQINIGNAAFAFPQSNGAIAGINSILHADFRDVRFEVTGTQYANSPCAIYAQRPLYDANLTSTILRYTKYGLVITPPTTNFASVEYAPDGCVLDKVEFFNTFPLITFNAIHWGATVPQFYSSSVGDIGPMLLQYQSLGRNLTSSFVVDDIYVETNASTAGAHGIYQGTDHDFVGGALKQATGAGYVYWSADHSTVIDNTILNDGANPALRMTGSRNRFTVHISSANQEASFIDDRGSGNDVRIGKTDSHPLEGRRVGINNPRPDALMRTGIFGAIGMARTPFNNLEDLFISPGDIQWNAPTPAPKITKDTTQESGEYVTLPTDGSGNFSVVNRQILTIGTRVPKCKIRTWIKMRAASGAPTQVLSLVTTGGVTRGTTNVTLSSSFQVFQFDSDIELAANGDLVQVTLNGNSGPVASDVAWIALQPIPVNLIARVGADVGDAAKTLTVGTDEQTQVWNTPITAARAVPLSTTGARNGDKFRIIRTAACTGAFNINVGTGPLKAMATAGSFADVEYNGATAAWMLTGYGTL